MTRSNSYLNTKQLDLIKKKLLSEKERIIHTEFDEGRFCLDKNELLDPLDEASANAQASHELRFRNRENFYLKKILKTLERLDKGTLGLCEDCDAEIAFERLLARPTADLCISCKEDAELSESHSFHHQKSKSLGKAMHELS